MTDEVLKKLNKLGINHEKVQVLRMSEQAANKLARNQVVVFELEHKSALYPRYIALQVVEEDYQKNET